MSWWHHWMVGQVDASLVAVAMLAITVAGRRRLSPSLRSALLALALVRLALPPWLRFPWSEAAAGLAPVEGARLVVAGWLQGDLFQALFAATTLVSAWLLIGLAWRMAHNRRQWLSLSVPAPVGLQVRVRALSAQAGLRKVPEVRVSTNGEGPLATGVRRPLIVLPAQAAALDAEALDAVLAHEVAHHARHDLVWLAAAECLRAIAWFNPLSHVLARALTSAREEASDDWAVSRTSGDPDAYCHALMRSARLAAGLAPAGAVAAHPMGRRLKRLLDPRTNRSRRPGLAGATLALLATVAALPGARADTPSSPGAEDGSVVVVEIVIR